MQNKQLYTIKKKASVPLVQISENNKMKIISVSEEPAAIVSIAIPYSINHHSNDHGVHVNLMISCINKY